MTTGNKIITISFEDGLSANLTAEYLRCFSPSAEVRGHTPGQEKLQTNKEDVAIDKIEPVGNYAVQLFFDDGHNTGCCGKEPDHYTGALARIVAEMTGMPAVIATRKDMDTNKYHTSNYGNSGDRLYFKHNWIYCRSKRKNQSARG